MSSSLHQLSGSLLGLCLGDALGAVVEAAPPLEARRYVEEYLRAGRAGERGIGELPFGQYTDDTQLARELLLSIAAHAGFEPAAFGLRIAALVGAGALVGGGPATRWAAARLQAGARWEESGMPAPYAGNGAAMRAGPLGVLWGDDAARLTTVVTEQSRVTHQDPHAAAGALAIAGAVALARRQEAIDPHAYLSQLGAWTEGLDASVGASIRELEQWIGFAPAEAAARLAEEGREAGEPDGWSGVPASVSGSVVWSLYAFLRSPDDYWDAICTAIWIGGDTDTMAAMTGAISGARLGIGALPAPLLQQLNDRGTWSLAELTSLCERAHRAVHPTLHS